MKFLLDVCASSRSLQRFLADLGHEVLSIVEVDRRAEDTTILALAQQEERVFITEDKDFGELVFVRRLPHPTIIRFVEMRVEDQVLAMQEILDFHAADLANNSVIVVTKGRLHIRQHS